MFVIAHSYRSTPQVSAELEKFRREEEEIIQQFIRTVVSYSIGAHTNKHSASRTVMISSG